MQKIGNFWVKMSNFNHFFIKKYRVSIGRPGMLQGVHTNVRASIWTRGWLAA